VLLCVNYLPAQSAEWINCIGSDAVYVRDSLPNYTASYLGRPKIT